MHPCATHPLGSVPLIPVGVGVGVLISVVVGVLVGVVVVGVVVTLLVFAKYRNLNPPPHMTFASPEQGTLHSATGLLETNGLPEPSTTLVNVLAQ